MAEKHQIGDPVYCMKSGEFGYISDYFKGRKDEWDGYMITWLPTEDESNWLDETYIRQYKHELRIYLGEIPPTQVR